MIATKNSEKYCICTDTHSAIVALLNLNINSDLTNRIRDLLTKQKNKIKLMWGPGHSGIPGNEFADFIAKNLEKGPVLFFNVLEKADLHRAIKKHCLNKALLEWENYQHNYKLINPYRLKPIFPQNSKHADVLECTRLRLGHTQINHSYLLKSGNPGCVLCNAHSTSVLHLLDICPNLNYQRKTIFGTTTPSQLLSVTTASNINQIINFLNSCKQTHLI